jgi:hypothetical protein
MKLAITIERDGFEMQSFTLLWNKLIDRSISIDFLWLFASLRAAGRLFAEKTKLGTAVHAADALFAVVMSTLQEQRHSLICVVWHCAAFTVEMWVQAIFDFHVNWRDD